MDAVRKRAFDAAMDLDGRHHEAEAREYVRDLMDTVLAAVGYPHESSDEGTCWCPVAEQAGRERDALRAERDRYKADLDKVADVFNARDAVTEGDAKLYASQPGEALANAVADILDDLSSMTDAAHCEARRAVVAEAERDLLHEALVAAVDEMEDALVPSIMVARARAALDAKEGTCPTCQGVNPDDLGYQDTCPTCHGEPTRT